jgi:uncharacterized phosphosugar-binding protein
VFDYFDLVRELLDEVQRSEQESMEQAAMLIACAIARGRVLHYFAAGHSHILGEEMFYRAGGLAPVNAIMEPSLMVSNGASKSSKLECLHGLAKVILEESGVERGDVLMVASTSGVNAVPVEMAAEAVASGIKVIGITSIGASKATLLRNGSGKRLFELADIVIDTHVPYGDAAIQVEGVAQRIAPLSTVVGVAIVNALVVRTVKILVEQGIEPPVFASANIPGGQEFNAALLKRYKDQVRAF